MAAVELALKLNDAEARIRELGAENLGLRKTVEVDGKEIAELREALGAADKALYEIALACEKTQPVIYRYAKGGRTKITAALKGA